MPKSEPLTPAQRSMRARVAATARWATSDPREGTAKAREAGPAGLEFWLNKVDPDHAITDNAERERRAACAKRAHFQALALRSSVARSRRAS